MLEVRPVSRPFGPTIPRLMLGKALREMRERKGMSREEAGENFGWSEGKIRTIENGQVGVDKVDLAALLALYGESDDSGELDELRKQSRQRGFWVKYGPVQKTYATYLDLESAAKKVSSFDLAVVNGLMQTPEYARAAIEVPAPGIGPDEVERLVQLRAVRQQRLTADDPLGLWAILDEAALCRVIGGPEVMRVQLEKLLELADLPNIDLQVVPFAAGAHPGTWGSFTLLEFPESLRPPAVYIETRGGEIYLEDNAEVKRCNLSYVRLCATALSPAESKKLIRSIAREL